jgi:hypothetical protein
MKRHLIFVLAFFCLAAAPRAYSQEFCSNLRTVIAAAPSEFESLLGERLQVNLPNLEVFTGVTKLSADDSCNVAQQTVSGECYSTSYTCHPAGPDTEAGMQSLATRLHDCLDVSLWSQQKQQDGRGSQTAQYGLIRLSITRNGDSGLALGVEVFRDEHGDIMGSPTRGNIANADPNHACHAKKPEEIAAYLAMYGARPGAVRFENDLFVGYTNRVSAPTVAFATKPNHPAHPALILRNVEQVDGAVLISVSGDFAGDCKAFQNLLQETALMSQSIKQTSNGG